jgi:hypothetical protein
MAYTTGDLILDDHYNTFATGNTGGSATDSANVNNVWGVGTADRGYGQTTTLSAVSAGTTITATQWATMLSRITSMASHQGSSITAVSSPSAGNTIAAFTALSTNITTVHTNRLTNTAFGATAATTTAGSASWTANTVHEITVTFADTNSARYYFNAGGEIRIDTAISGGTADGKYDEWADLANTLAGQVVFGSQGTTKTGGTGSPTTLATTLGYHDLTTSYQTIYQQYADSSPYTTNYIRVQAKYTGATTNGGKGNVITFEVRYQDDADDTVYDKAVYTPADVMDGTVTTTTTIAPPSTSYLANTWGTPGVGGTNSQS